MNEVRMVTDTSGLGRWTVRILAIVGCAFLVLGTMGWLLGPDAALLLRPPEIVAAADRADAPSTSP